MKIKLNKRVVLEEMYTNGFDFGFDSPIPILNINTDSLIDPEKFKDIQIIDNVLRNNSNVSAEEFFKNVPTGATEYNNTNPNLMGVIKKGSPDYFSSDTDTTKIISPTHTNVNTETNSTTTETNTTNNSTTNQIKTNSETNSAGKTQINKNDVAKTIKQGNEDNEGNMKKALTYGVGGLALGATATHLLHKNRN